MKIQVCTKCGKRHLPFKARCYCGSRAFEYREESISGVLIVYTTIYVTPKGFPSPLRAGIVNAGDLKLLVRLEGEARLGDLIEVTQGEDGVLVGRPKHIPPDAP